VQGHEQEYYGTGRRDGCAVDGAGGRRPDRAKAVCQADHLRSGASPQPTSQEYIDQQTRVRLTDAPRTRNEAGVPDYRGEAVGQVWQSLDTRHAGTLQPV